MSTKVSFSDCRRGDFLNTHSLFSRKQYVHIFGYRKLRWPSRGRRPAVWQLKMCTYCFLEKRKRVLKKPPPLQSEKDTFFYIPPLSFWSLNALRSSEIDFTFFRRPAVGRGYIPKKFSALRIFNRAQCAPIVYYLPPYGSRLQMTSLVSILDCLIKRLMKFSLLAHENRMGGWKH